MAAKDGKQRVSRTEINLWAMIRDLGVASINKGQLPQAVLGAVLIIMAWRLPEDDVAALAREVLGHLVDYSLVGWALSGIITLLWFSHAKRQRRNWTAEMRRLAEERNRYQERALNEKLGSSNK